MQHKFFFVIMFLTLPLLFSCQRTENRKITAEFKSEFRRILDSLKLNGSILIYDNNNLTYYSNNFELAKQRHLPASTFKIPNSIIAIELGIIESDSTLIKWNGDKRRLKVWEQDLTFKKAFQVSCVPCYQEIARKIGFERMKEFLKKFEYNEMIFDTLTLDKFWLEGNSGISQQEQIDFLKKFYFSGLPISERTEKIVKNIMQTEKTETYTLSGKTGWGIRNGENNGWYVGFLETAGNVYFFALNVFPKDDFNMDDFANARIDAVKETFEILNLKVSQR